MKKCPFCAEEIQSDAIKCKHCGEWLFKKTSTIGKQPIEASQKSSTSQSSPLQDSIIQKQTILNNKSNNGEKKNIIVDVYEKISLAGISLPAIVLAMLSTSYPDPVIGEKYIYPIAIRAALFALLIFGIVGIISYLKYHRFPWARQYFSGLLFSIFFLPIFAITFIQITNCTLDNSSPIVRRTVIVDMAEDHHSRKGIQHDNYYAYVQSWRSDIDKIKISVSRSEFAQFQGGDYVSLKTRKGYWGLEYLSENQ